MGNPIEWRIERLLETDSTNLAVKRAIREDAPEGTVFTAVRQTGGYGRQGRAWASPEGSLYASLLLRPPARDVAELPSLSLVTGLAVRDGVLGAFPVLGALAHAVSVTHVSHGSSGDDGRVLVKWPNDVLLGDAKLSGISLELAQGALCIGIGVNVFPPLGMPAPRPNGKYHLAYAATAAHAAALALNDPEAATLEAEASSYRARRSEIARLLDKVLASFGTRYAEWLESGFASFKDEFESVMAYRGKEVVMETVAGDTRESGIIRGVDAQGRLLVEGVSKGAPTGVVSAVTSGEIHFV